MTNSSAGEPRRSSLFWRLYTLSWVCLAGVAVGYLSVVLTNPELVAKLSNGAAMAASGQENIEAQKRVTAELQTLRESVSSLRNDLERVETRVASAAKPPVEVAKAAPITAPEPAASQPKATAAIPALVPINAAEKTPQLATQTVTTQPVRVGRLPPLPVRGPERPQRVAAPRINTGAGGTAVILNNGQIVTGSVPKAPALNIAPTPTPPLVPQPDTSNLRFGAPQPAATALSNGTPATAVVVSAASTLAGLRASWQQLSSKHPALLGTLEPRYDAMGADGPYRLLAGPLSDRVEADRLCSELRANGVTCGVGAFVGKVL